VKVAIVKRFPQRSWVLARDEEGDEGLKLLLRAKELYVDGRRIDGEVELQLEVDKIDYADEVAYVWTSPSYSLSVNTTRVQLAWPSLSNETLINATIMYAEISNYPELWQLYNKTLEIHLAKPVDDKYLVYYNVCENTVFCDWRRVV